MPGIFIGIGGIGGSIVAKLSEALTVRVALAKETPSAVQAADQFRFMLVDTWKDGVSAGFDASQVLDFPEGKDKFDVDAKIESWWRGGDPAFRSWWPQRQTSNGESGAPLLAGPYASGAGQLRVKGRLAYRVSLTGLGRQAMPAVLENLREIDAVLGPAAGIRTVPVYLISSLGGGSGSGMALTFAQHIRETLPDYCPIIGVFPLASVTELGPGSADTSSIWANTDSALREIDYCQRVNGNSENALSPFFQWPGKGTVIMGNKRPFEYIYLYGRDNQSGQSLDEFSKYLNLITETLIAESFASLTDEGMQNAIRGPHSQFIMQLQARPDVGGRSTTYASAAIAALVFPTERVERHLARRFAIDVLARMTDEDDAIVAAEVEAFMRTHALLWEGTPSFGKEFDKPYTEMPGRVEKKLRDFPNPLSLEDDSPFLKENAADAKKTAQDAAQDLDAYLGKQVFNHYRQRNQEIKAAFSGPDGYLRAAVVSWLNEGGASALGLAFESVTGIRGMIEAQWRLMNELIDGNHETGAKGERGKLDDARGSYASAVEGLEDGFSSGFGSFFNRYGKAVKAELLENDFPALEEVAWSLQRMVIARQTYRELIVSTIQMQRVLKDLKDNAVLLREKLEHETETDIGEHGRTGVLDLTVLNHPRLLAHHFHDLLEETRRVGVEACATLVTAVPRDSGDLTTIDAALDVDGELIEQRDSLATTGVVMETFNRMLNPLVGASTLTRDRYVDQLELAIVSDGVSRLGRRVREMSIWDALAAECKARTALGLHDAAVEQADREIKIQRQNAEDAGVPPRDWEQLILQFFIRRRLEEVQKRVRPFWNLNGLMTANYGQPYRIDVLATDEKAYRLAETTHGIKGFLDLISSLMGSGTPKWLPGKDRIAIYSREGVVPLFYLNDRELKVMRDSSADKARDKFLYTDVRFAECVDPVIRPAESADERLLYAIGLALEHGDISWSQPEAGAPWQALLRVSDDARSAASLAELALQFEDDPKLTAAFMGQIDSAIRALPEDQHQAVQHRAQIAVAELMRADSKRQLTEADMKLLAHIEDAILVRMNYGQPFVNE